MSNYRYGIKKRANSAKVNPEVIRKAKKLLEVYNQIPVPNIITNTLSIDVQMMIRNGCFTINDQLKKFVYRCIASHERNFDPDNVVCTCISGTTDSRGSLLFQTKEKERYQWINVSSCRLKNQINIVWNCPFCRQIYDDLNINAKVLNDIPERRRYANNNIVQIPNDKEIIYPIFINNDKGDLINIMKKSGICVSGDERLFPFISKYDHYEYRWYGLINVTVHIVYSYASL